MVDDTSPGEVLGDLLQPGDGGNEAALVPAMVDSLPALFMLFDRKGGMRHWNKRFISVSGYTIERCRGLRFDRLFRSPSAPGRWAQCLDEQLPESQNFEELLTTCVGREIPFLLGAARLSVKGETMIALGGIDLTEQRRAERRLHRLAYFDPNTRLPNRLGFPREVSALLERHGSTVRAQLAVAVFDVYRFQAINDTIGYRGGDELLREIGSRFRSRLDAEEFVADLGKGTFAVLLWNVRTTGDAQRAGQRILNLLQPGFQSCGQALSLSASVGIAPVCDGGDPVSWLGNADHAMHVAKRQGAGSVVVFADSMRLVSEQRLKLENELRAAVKNDELRVFFQPLVRVEDASVVGYEALLRWIHPLRGLVYPADFVPLAESAGLVAAVDGWVMHHGIRLAERLPSGMFLNINASAHSLRSESWVAAIEALSAACQLPVGRVKVEITETALMDDEELVRETLGRLSRCGVDTVLDDFGTGYSALSHLRNFPITGIKIDKSFISRMKHFPRDRRIIAGISSLAHELGLSVTAEGIETDAQYQSLRELGCDLAQGYLFSRPEPAGSFLNTTNETEFRDG